MSYTAQEVENAIDEFDREEFIESLLWGEKKVVLPDVGTATLISEEGGEGQGDSYVVIFNISGEFYSFIGYYSSYDGTDWGDASVVKVKPVEKTVIVYERADD
jgi:hypothetical protein